MPVSQRTSGTYVGVGVGGSVNLGFQLLSQKDSRLSWNWMFQVLGPSLDSVWDDIVWDFANNPCGECTPP